MMSKLSVYYASRMLLALVFGGLFLAAGLPWWAAVPITAAMIAFFLWAPKSGRYVVQSNRGATPMRADEYGQTVRNQAARDAFIVTTLGVAGAILYGYGVRHRQRQTGRRPIAAGAGRPDRPVREHYITGEATGQGRTGHPLG
jgi:hypothetical protein